MKHQNHTRFCTRSGPESQRSGHKEIQLMICPTFCTRIYTSLSQQQIMSGGESNYSDEKSMQEDVDDLSIGGYESGVQCVREIIAVNDERLPCDTSDEYNSTIAVIAVSVALQSQWAESLLRAFIITLMRLVILLNGLVGT